MRHDTRDTIEAKLHVKTALEKVQALREQGNNLTYEDLTTELQSIQIWLEDALHLI